MEEVSLWEWLRDLSQGQASFLGSLTGAAIGLIALLLGALFNAYLNRRRDDRLRREDQRAVAIALRSELEGLRRILKDNAEDLKQRAPKPDEEILLVADPASSIRIMPEMVSKLGLLDGAIISSVVKAYSLVEEYWVRLLLLGGKIRPHDSRKRSVALPADKAPDLIRLNTVIAEVVQEAIAQLDRFLR
jgi:hypothetical protein